MKELAVDPALHVAVHGTLALLFAWAAYHKLRDPAGFRAALARYEMMPPGWLGAFTVLLIAAEIMVSVGLLWPPTAAGTALAAAGLLALYAGAIGTNLLRGRRDIDCGCAGMARRRPLSGALVGRNAVLCVAALVGALPAATRPLAWIDAVTITGAIAVLVLLYGALDGLLAHAPQSTVLSLQLASGSLPVATLRRGSGRASGNGEGQGGAHA